MEIFHKTDVTIIRVTFIQFTNYKGIIMKRLYSFSFITVVMVLSCSFHTYAEPGNDDVTAAMKKAASFMANTVANRGGYVYNYSEDLSEQWGEVSARKTQIWVQPPGTPTVGMMYLEAYKATGDPDYLGYAKKAANALIWGQHTVGGWHYLIDFDMTGIQKWYDEVATRCWGWQEYLHYYGNSSFDDYTTSAPTRFLLELYMATLDPAYRVPLLKALDFILESQYPNGAWPQRYPLKYDHPYDGHDDYSSYYTFNDDVMSDTIAVLMEAYEKLGDERYRQAAYRGMDFYLVAQLPEPQAGWAQQYTYDMKPGWGRSYEPDGICTGQTLGCIADLQKFYKITGDRKYLRPIPGALKWLEDAIITEGLPEGKTHAYFYELGTNKALWTHREGTNIDDGRYWTDYDITDYYPYGVPVTLNIEYYKQEFERIRSLSPEDARAEYEKDSRTKSHVNPADPVEIERLISSLDNRGAWITDVRLPQFFGDAIKEPWDTIRGIDIRVFLKNMQTLIDFLSDGDNIAK